MMKKLFLLGFILIGFQFISAQEVLNNYKYVIVPKQFEFQSGADSFRINSFVKFLLDKKGFSTLFSDEVYPDDLMTNQCLALKANLIKKPSFMKTKIILTLTTCQNKIIYQSKEGVSREKDFKRAYYEAIRNMYKSLTFNYKYTPRELTSVVKSKPVTNKTTVVKTTPKPTVVVKKTEVKIKVPKKEVPKIIKEAKGPYSLEGSYKYKNDNFEIAIFKNYYVFSKLLKKGAIPLGFIYKTSQEGSYLVKNSNGSFTGYLKDNGSFVIDEINNDGTVNSVVYVKSKN